MPEKKVPIQKPNISGLSSSIHMVPMDNISGFDVRPGFYEVYGATAIPGGVNFTALEPRFKRIWFSRRGSPI